MPGITDMLNPLNQTPDEDLWKLIARTTLKVCGIVALIVACFLAIVLLWKLGIVFINNVVEQQKMLMEK